MNEQPDLNNINSLPYGTWPSAITSELIVSDSTSLDEVHISSQSLYYIERRPQENGRCVIVRVTDGSATDILPPPFSARSRVHEYGGGCYCVSEDLLFFINDSDQDIYTITDEKISRLTDEKSKTFADFVYDEKRHRLITICQSSEQQQVTNSIVSIDINTSALTTIEYGDDFYASPRLDSRCNRLCWQSWNHPNMPWDGNQLCLADVDNDGHINNKQIIAGADNIAVFQPRWSPDDILYFISDDSGWWHLYRYLIAPDSTSIQRLTEGNKEFGLPQWVFAQSNYDFIDATKIICSYRDQGESHLAILSLTEEITLTNINIPWQEFSSLTADNNSIAFIASSDTCFPQLVHASVDKADKLTTSVVKRSCQSPLSREHYSKAQTITFINRHQQTVYATYYPPVNPVYCGMEDTRPPLIVICHGGPTGQNSAALDPKKQFWTSRGFAILDVNYSGSTGYGRDYRLRLNNNWGILDVEDCCDAALFAVSKGLADKNRLIIRGSSAGGYTVLSALTFSRVFSAGASYYGISELCSLAEDTHKFEAHYLDSLIGPYPEAREQYQRRSPINSTDQLDCPVMFFQGDEDKVVPRSQAERMFEALDKKGLPVAAQYFPGEQHGFRKAETIKQALENELSFYQLVLNLRSKDEIHFKGDISISNI